MHSPCRSFQVLQVRQHQQRQPVAGRRNPNEINLISAPVSWWVLPPLEIKPRVSLYGEPHSLLNLKGTLP